MGNPSAASISVLLPKCARSPTGRSIPLSLINRMRRRGRDALAAVHGLGAGRAFIHTYLPEVVEEILREPSGNDNLQCLDLRVVQLDVAKVRTTGLDGVLQHIVQGAAEIV